MREYAQVGRASIATEGLQYSPRVSPTPRPASPTDRAPPTESGSRVQGPSSGEGYSRVRRVFPPMTGRACPGIRLTAERKEAAGGRDEGDNSEE